MTGLLFLSSHLKMSKKCLLQCHHPIQIYKCFEMFGVDGRRVILKVILSLVEGSHLLTPSVCLFDIGAVCFYNMTDVRSDDHYNSDERVPGYSFGR